MNSNNTGEMGSLWDWDNIASSIVNTPNMNRKPQTAIDFLFTSPMQGGILQSSGFLDLKSLVSLSRTAKVNEG